MSELRHRTGYFDMESVVELASNALSSGEELTLDTNEETLEALGLVPGSEENWYISNLDAQLAANAVEDWLTDSDTQELRKTFSRVFHGKMVLYSTTDGILSATLIDPELQIGLAVLALRPNVSQIYDSEGHPTNRYLWRKTNSHPVSSPTVIETMEITGSPSIATEETDITKFMGMRITQLDFYPHGVAQQPTT